MFRSSIDAASRKAFDCRPNFLCFQTCTAANGWFRNTTLTQRQRAQMFAGGFPADSLVKLFASRPLSRSMIGSTMRLSSLLCGQLPSSLPSSRVRSSSAESKRQEREAAQCHPLELEGPRCVTTIRSKMSPLHRSMVCPLNWMAIFQAGVSF